MTFPRLFDPLKSPLGWGGSIVLPENESHISPNMYAKFGCGTTVVSKKGGYRHRRTDKRTLQLYIVDVTSYSVTPYYVTSDYFTVSFAYG